MIDLSDRETQKIIYTIFMFSFAYFLAFMLLKITSKDSKKSKK